MSKHKKDEDKGRKKGKGKGHKKGGKSLELEYVIFVEDPLQEALSIRYDFERGLIGLRAYVFAFETYVSTDNSRALSEHSQEFTEVLNLVADIQSIMMSYADTYGIELSSYVPIFTDIYECLVRIEINLEEKQRKDKTWRASTLELVSQIGQVTITLAQAVAIITGHAPLAAGLGIARSVLPSRQGKGAN